MDLVKKKVLFVCVGNSCRSQMAESIARRTASDIIEPSSAGLLPLGKIAELTQKALREKGYDVDGQSSKPLGRDAAEFDGIIVNMTGIPGGSLFAGARVEDWEVDDPFGFDITVHRRVRDEIERLVAGLAERLRGTNS
jgi:arsenate reductase